MKLFLNFAGKFVKLAVLIFAMLNAIATHADTFDSASVKICYAVTGAGEPVILIHGLSSSARLNWDKPGVTALLAKNFLTITLDCRGHGQSDRPEAADAYGTNMVGDVVRLMDHLHVAKARVVGYSMGGMLAMKLMATHPERVVSAVLGGMGWHRADAPMNHFWETAGNRGRLRVPAACPHSFPALAVTEAEIKAMKTPVTVIVGDRDPCRQMYVEPVQKIRPDWPVHLVADATHMNCVTTAEFKTLLQAALR